MADELEGGSKSDGAAKTASARRIGLVMGHLTVPSVMHARRRPLHTCPRSSVASMKDIASISSYRVHLPKKEISGVVRRKKKKETSRRCHKCTRRKTPRTAVTKRGKVEEGGMEGRSTKCNPARERAPRRSPLLGPERGGGAVNWLVKMEGSVSEWVTGRDMWVAGGDGCTVRARDVDDEHGTDVGPEVAKAAAARAAWTEAGQPVSRKERGWRLLGRGRVTATGGKGAWVDTGEHRVEVYERGCDVSSERDGCGTGRLECAAEAAGCDGEQDSRWRYEGEAAGEQTGMTAGGVGAGSGEAWAADAGGATGQRVDWTAAGGDRTAGGRYGTAQRRTGGYCEGSAVWWWEASLKRSGKEVRHVVMAGRTGGT
ncbi:hypothetical protein B0H16DRAFT_1800654 [Mycena metata]|uniref:Uncharacterized protein n=1 Tax=Mycena metata TaxID=1033252 RepID=A0AAD7HBB5_9AGAR|nr:hypothetical protein B0H16DRAFT_1800654 [Mycena metata]